MDRYVGTLLATIYIGGTNRETLPAQYADSVDLKDGLHNNRICTVKFPVLKVYCWCKTTHTDLNCIELS